MEEPVERQASADVRPKNGNGGRRRKTRHHGLLHLHRAQRWLLARAAVFVVMLLVMLMVWYWMAARR